jgi:hypothetical protein
VGGCCGAGPDHLSAIARSVASVPAPRLPSPSNNGGHFDPALYPPGTGLRARRPRFLLSGTETLEWCGGEARLAVAVDIAGLVTSAPACCLAPALAAVRAAAADPAAAVVWLSMAAGGAASDAATEKLVHVMQGEPALSSKPIALSVQPLDAAGRALLIRLLKCLQGRFTARPHSDSACILACFLRA